MKLKLLMISFMCLAVTACCDPDPEKVLLPTKNSVLNVVDSYKTKKAIQALNETDRNLLKAYLVRTSLDSALGLNDGDAINIRQAIQAQQEWVAAHEAEVAKQQAIKEEEAANQKAIQEAEAAKQQAFKDNEAKQQAILEEISKSKAEALAIMNTELNASLASLKLQKKDYKKKIYSDYIDIEMVIKNNSESELSGFKGILILKDTMGTPVKTLEISASAEIEAGQAVLYTTKFDHNPLLDEDKLLATLDLNKIHYEWVPSALTFKDGEVLKMPN